MPNGPLWTIKRKNCVVHPHKVFKHKWLEEKWVTRKCCREVGWGWGGGFWNWRQTGAEASHFLSALQVNNKFQRNDTLHLVTSAAHLPFSWKFTTILFNLKSLKSETVKCFRYKASVAWVQGEKKAFDNTVRTRNSLLFQVSFSRD